MLFATIYNFGLDLYYIFWVMTLRGRLPPSMGSFVSDAVFGYTKKLTRELYSNLDKSQRTKVEEIKHKMKIEHELSVRNEKEKAATAKEAQAKEKNAKKEADFNAKSSDKTAKKTEKPVPKTENKSPVKEKKEVPAPKEENKKTVKK